MLSLTVLYAVLTLLVLVVIFGVTYKIKGLPAALVATGVAFVLSVLVLVAFIFLITSTMPN